MNIYNYYNKIKHIENNNIINFLIQVISFITLLYFIQIAYLTYKNEKPNNFTPFFLIIGLLSSIFWSIFGYYKNNLLLIISSITGFFVYSYLLYMKIKY